MQKRLAALAASLVLTALAGCASMQPGSGPVKVSNGMLVDAQGMTLYTFDRDAAGKSACNGPCVAMWPPVMAAADAKTMSEFTVVKRDDGAGQWAYKGKPVYRFKDDMAVGDTKGENFRGVWHIARP
ncbi:hypothetical protein GT347_22795 [Xylophilus rhododendri]|uniref:Lipoprotein n=1 Tax=Xylophilus rhododendri TaxID=2697032 RepID=A0A857JD03_9BURK|nr:hypothetical protein [Xylophilus rhododendri]QHJ00556.1 hypothetical protein GT347_22795 [Xylophilus rhododendri]